MEGAGMKTMIQTVRLRRKKEGKRRKSKQKNK